VKQSPADFYNTVDPARWGRSEMPGALQITSEWLALVEPGNDFIVELGCGLGALAGISPHSVSIDLSIPALALAIDAGRRICADMEQLPLGNDSIGFLFSWAAIEHVPNPERVLAEVERVLRPGGVALLAPAWHCRPWAAEGLEFRRYQELTLSQRIRKALLPLRNAIWWRAIFELPRRVAREWRGRRGALPFEYRRLTPNLEQYAGTDSDAFTSMDPHAAILYFATRRWDVLSHSTFRARFASRSEPVVVRKPG